MKVFDINSQLTYLNDCALPRDEWEHPLHQGVSRPLRALQRLREVPHLEEVQAPP